MINQSTQAGELVIDPFMGSASVGEAALGLGRSFAGCDISDDAMSVATGRLERCGFRAGDPFANRAGQRGLFGVAT